MKAGVTRVLWSNDTGSRHAHIAHLEVFNGNR